MKKVIFLRVWYESHLKCVGLSALLLITALDSRVETLVYFMSGFQPFRNWLQFYALLLKTTHAYVVRSHPA